MPKIIRASCAHIDEDHTTVVQVLGRGNIDLYRAIDGVFPFAFFDQLPVIVVSQFGPGTFGHASLSQSLNEICSVAFVIVVLIAIPSVLRLLNCQWAESGWDRCFIVPLDRLTDLFDTSEMPIS